MEAGVGLAIRTFPTRWNQWVPHDVVLPLNRTHHVTFISTYAPTLTRPDEAKEQLYYNLGHLIKAASPSDKLIILGDFIVRVGTVSDDLKGVLGLHSVGNLSSIDLLLLSYLACCTSSTPSLVKLTSTKQPGCTQDPGSGTLLTLLLSSRDIQDVRITPAMHSAECWTYHRFVRYILKLHIAPT